jgi:hypothetical protein
MKSSSSQDCYVVQKGFGSALPHITKDLYRCMEAVLLHNGYHSVPRMKMLWDCHNYHLVVDIRRNSMDAMLQCLHFRDNTRMVKDGYFKVWPIFANLNQAGHWFMDEGQFSVER